MKREKKNGCARVERAACLIAVKFDGERLALRSGDGETVIRLDEEGDVVSVSAPNAVLDGMRRKRR